MSDTDLFGAARPDGAAADDDSAPAEALNYRMLGNRGLAKTWPQRALDNLTAIRLAKEIEAAGRPATEDEQEALMKFIGFGATDLANNLFPSSGDTPKSWSNMARELRAILSKEELAGLARATQYAHYTPEYIVRSIWRGLKRMGFTGGAVLEPGCGTGLFNALMPEGMASRSSFLGIEADATTASIAKLLHPESDILRADFTRAKVPEGFDLAIGNPPFSTLRVNADDMPTMSLHDHFIARSIERLRAGGLAAFVVSRYTMDKQDRTAREYIASMADLLAAIRLPEGAMRADAGTDVVVDLLFLRKRDAGDTPLASRDERSRWMDTTILSSGIYHNEPYDGIGNEYFKANPELVLGRHAITSSQHGPSYTCAANNTPLAMSLPLAMERLPQGIYSRAPALPSRMSASVVDAPKVAVGTAADGATIKEGSFFVADNTLYQVVDGKPERSDVAQGGKVDRCIKGLVRVRDAVRAVLRAQLADQPFEAAQDELRAAYGAFVAKFGAINKVTRSFRTVKEMDEDNGVERDVEKVTERRPNLSPFLDDPDCWLVASIASYDIDSDTETPGPIFTQRVIRPVLVADVRDAGDALAVTLSEKGRVDIEHTAGLLGKTATQVIEELGDGIYFDPAKNTWTTADDYLSGQVRTKLARAHLAAEENPGFRRNVEALEKVQPEDLKPSDITARLGAPWIPTDVIEAFIEEAMGISTQVVHTPNIASWTVAQAPFWNKAAATSEWGTARREAGELIEDALNSRVPQIYDTWRDADGKKHQRINVVETEAAKEKLTKIKGAFEKWAWRDAERAARLVRLYNDQYNNIVPRVFDGSHLKLHGASNVVTFRPNQLRGVWRIIVDGSTYLAHAVGSGKTFTSIAACMEQKRLGLISKPMIVVPSHTLAQWATEWMRLYPDAKILVADEQNFAKDKRTRFLARAATENWDAIIITHTAFKFIPSPADFERKMVQDVLENFEDMIESCSTEDRVSRKRLERIKEGLEKKLEGLSSRKDNMIHIGEVGVDQIVVDECFPYDTIIETDQGPMKIGDIVENRAHFRVLSYNHQEKKVEWKKIVRWLPRGDAAELVRVVHESGSFICTPDHPVATDQGYIEAQNLQGKVLWKLRNPVLANGWGSEVLLSDVPRHDGRSEHERNVSGVQKAVSLPRHFIAQGGEDLLEGVLEGTPVTNLGREGDDAGLPGMREAVQAAACESRPAVLLGFVCEQVAVSRPSEGSGLCGAHLPALGMREGTTEPQGVSPYEGTQSYAEPGNAGSRGRLYARQDIPGAWWERATYSTSDHARDRVGIADGVRNQDCPCEGYVPEPAEPLHGGHSVTGASAGYRGGWSNPSAAEVEVLGQTQDRDLIGSRVVSVEVLEPRSPHWPSGLHRKSECLYDLEVEGNHNFFAEGILAHNCQEFRKLTFATNMSTLKGIDPNGSQRAWDLFIKVKFLETTNPGRSIILASGTPITNTMGELFTVLRFMYEAGLYERRIQEFDAWASTFGDATTDLELQPSGLYKPMTRFAKFVNVPELIAMFRMKADVVQRADLRDYMDLPVVKGGKRQLVTSDQTPEFKGLQRWLARRIKLIEERKRPPQKGDDIILTVINDGRHLAIHPRFLSDKAPVSGNTKLDKLVDNVFRVWKETSENVYVQPGSLQRYSLPGAAQMVFSDIGTESMLEVRGFSAYTYLKNRLVNLGVPANQIEFMQHHKKASQKIRLFTAVNEGRVRVLIGSSQTMGTGVNAQTRLKALHHLDVPWIPAWIEQREGRIERQGNQNEEIEIYAYATLGSMDATMWQTNERKARFIAAAMSGDKSVRVLEEEGGQAAQFAMAKAIASGDPRLMQLAGLEAEVARLRRLEAAHFDDQHAVRSKLATAHNVISYANKRVPQIQEDLKRRKTTRGELFSATIRDVEYKERTKVADIIISRLRVKEKAQEVGDTVLCNVGGFDVIATGTKTSSGWFYVDVAIDRTEYAQELKIGSDQTGMGFLAKIENHIEGMDADLYDLEYRKNKAEREIRDYTSRLDAVFEFEAELVAKSVELHELKKALEATKEDAANDETVEQEAA